MRSCIIAFLLLCIATGVGTARAQVTALPANAQFPDATSAPQRAVHRPVSCESRSAQTGPLYGFVEQTASGSCVLYLENNSDSPVAVDDVNVFNCVNVGIGCGRSHFALHETVIRPHANPHLGYPYGLLITVTPASCMPGCTGRFVTFSWSVAWTVVSSASTVGNEAFALASKSIQLRAANAPWLQGKFLNHTFVYPNGTYGSMGTWVYSNFSVEQCELSYQVFYGSGLAVIMPLARLANPTVERAKDAPFYSVVLATKGRQPFILLTDQNVSPTKASTASIGFVSEQQADQAASLLRGAAASCGGGGND